MNPSKYIRKAIITALNGTGLKVYDSHNPFSDEKEFVVLSTQTGLESQENKCYGVIECDIIVDIIVRYQTGTGSRLRADDIMETVLLNTTSLSIENYEIITMQRDFPSDLVSQNSTETINRKFIRYNFKLRKL